MLVSLPFNIALTATLLLALARPIPVRASSAQAIAHGCYSCHGQYLRDEAPKFERLASRLAKFRGDPAAEQRFVDKYRAGVFFGHIDAHERLSPETARALIHWLVEGGGQKLALQLF